MIIFTRVLPIKTACVFILLFRCTSTIHAQPPVIEWQKVLGGTQWESPTSFLKTADGGYIVAGVSQSKDGDVSGAKGSTDIWIVKLYADGRLNWKKCYGGSNADFAPRILEIPTGFIIGGGTSSNNGNVKGSFGGNDIWLFRIDLDGNLLWQRCLGGGKDEALESIALATDGNVLVTFFSISTNGSMTGNHGKNDAFVGKVAAADGRVLWSRVLGGSEDDAFYELQPARDGGCILVGITNSNNGNVSGNHGITDLWVVKLKEDGTDDWSKLLGGSEREFGPRVTCTTDGNYFIATNTTSVDGDVNKTEPGMAVWMLKLTSAGVISHQHVQVLGGGGVHDLRVTPDGGVIVAHSGALSADGVGPGNILHKYTATLDHVWIKEYGGANQDYLLAVQPLADGSYATLGYSSSPEQPGYQGSSDIWIMKLDAAGTIIWEKLYGGSGEEKFSPACNHHYHISYAMHNIMDAAGNVFFAAQTYSSNSGDLTGNTLHYSPRTGLKPDIWIVKMSPGVTISSLKTVSANPKLFNLPFQHSAYPNPVKHKATIAFTAEQTAGIIIEVFNTQGMLVKKIKPGNTQKGTSYTYELDLTGLPAGNYVYRFKNGTKTGTGTLIKQPH